MEGKESPWISSLDPTVTPHCTGDTPGAQSQLRALFGHESSGLEGLARAFLPPRPRLHPCPRPRPHPAPSPGPFPHPRCARALSRSRRVAPQTTFPVVPRGGAHREAGTAPLAVHAGSCSPARLRRGQRGAAGSHYRERGAAAVALPRSAAPPPHGEGPPWRRSLAPARPFFPAAGAEGAAAVRPSAEGGSPASRSGCCPPRAALPGAMSLVAYASSEEDSDAEEPAGEEEEAADSPPAADEQPSSRGLFAALPPPRAPAVPPSFLTGPLPAVSGFGSAPPGQAGAESPPEPAASGDGAAESPRPRGLLLPPPRNAASPRSPPPAASPGPGLGLPKPKKRTEPVRIAAPELHKGDSDSEEDEPAKKKNTLQGRSEGSGLSALLPQPKNMTVKETNRLLLPYSFSRKAGENSSDSKPAKAPSSSSKSKAVPKPAVATTPSPSAIKAAAKSAALQERARRGGHRALPVPGRVRGASSRHRAGAAVPGRGCQRPAGVQDRRGLQRGSARLGSQTQRGLRQPDLWPVPLCLRRARGLLPGLLQQRVLPRGGTSPGLATGEQHRLLLHRRRSGWHLVFCPSVELGFEPCQNTGPFWPAWVSRGLGWVVFLGLWTRVGSFPQSAPAGSAGLISTQQNQLLRLEKASKTIAQHCQGHH
uniref:Proline rich mitotic checkpoint control factor n=1 Tax=Taeniopygia guttata TaxID=59729 RepID=A0A674GAT0_TAEGU